MSKKIVLDCDPGVALVATTIDVPSFWDEVLTAYARVAAAIDSPVAGPQY